MTPEKRMNACTTFNQIVLVIAVLLTFIFLENPAVQTGSALICAITGTSVAITNEKKGNRIIYALLATSYTILFIVRLVNNMF